MFFFQEPGGENHFFASCDTIPIRELYYNEEVKNVDGKNYLSENKRFIALLKYYTSDYPELRQELERLSKPEYKSLIDIAVKYNEYTCGDGSCVVFEKKISRKKIVRAYGGMSYLTPYLLDPGDENYFPVYGFEMLFQQVQQRESLYVGIGFLSNVTDLEYFPKVLIPISVNYINPKQGFSPAFSYSFSLNSFMLHSVSAGLRYQKKDFAFSLDAGLNTVFFIKPYGMTGSVSFSYLFN